MESKEFNLQELKKKKKPSVIIIKSKRTQISTKTCSTSTEVEQKNYTIKNQYK